MLLALADCTATRRGTAGAGKRPNVFVEIVVHGQLFAALDGAQAHIKDVASHDPADEIWIAAMVDDLGSAATHGTIQRPIGIQGEQVRVVAVASNLGLLTVQALAGVFNHLAIGGNALGGENSESVDLRTPDLEAKAGVLRIDLRRSDELGSHTVDSF